MGKEIDNLKNQVVVDFEDHPDKENNTVKVVGSVLFKRGQWIRKFKPDDTKSKKHYEDYIKNAVIRSLRNLFTSDKVSPISWFTGVCKNCKYNIVVTQPDDLNHPSDDYWWYCSNKFCKHHKTGEHTGDMESPDWVELKGRFADLE